MNQTFDSNIYTDGYFFLRLSCHLVPRWKHSCRDLPRGTVSDLSQPKKSRWNRFGSEGSSPQMENKSCPDVSMRWEYLSSHFPWFMWPSPTSCRWIDPLKVDSLLRKSEGWYDTIPMDSMGYVNDQNNLVIMQSDGWTLEHLNFSLIQELVLPVMWIPTWFMKHGTWMVGGRFLKILCWLSTFHILP